AGGVGKYLTIEIVGEGYVKATKVKSGETWYFRENGTEKVGAGTVELEAFASEGWNFSQWSGDLNSSENPTEYKTRKYGYVLAVFDERTYTITASAVGNGTIDPDDEVLVEYGADQTFDFIPDEGNHISAIVVDGFYLSSFAQNYTFYNVTADHTIVAYFSADGTATVPNGTDVTVFLASGAGLTFDDTDGGTATGDRAHPGVGLDYPNGTLAVAWDINVTFTFAGEVLVALQYDDTNLTDAEESNLTLIRAESIEALRSDVNQDLVVNGTDVSIVANAVKQSYWYDPLLDINNDGFVNEDDVHIVNENKGTTLVDITLEVSTDLNIIYGTTDRFSIFGSR
ncbi:MAG: hypothetical protein GWO20_18135, partial [Candidatus Korarchaeota archaeon]|nr:hypothetical protein [Candidatus Korarchaeota archaeon]